ncbi:inositol monophosphatase family protein [Streptomyces sp. NPDC060031]|uniref:inositol monophosphatase family protein n=1 Tax=Streptomyces sp. NPDC060031 TaxID=3347043 RepID=UPI0036B68FC8
MPAGFRRPYAEVGMGVDAGADAGADCAFAAGCVEAAGRLLLDLLLEQELGRAPGGERLAGLGRTSSGLLLRNRIRAWDPRDALLTPGAERGPGELGRARVWIADPLDGAREFREPGNPGWAVHLALWERGRGVVGAAVVVPALCEVASTSDPAGAWRRSMRVPRRMRLFTDAAGPGARVRAVGRELGAEVVGAGSAGAKTLALIRGEADAYVHAAGAWEWGSAALLAVAAAAGLHISRIDGRPLRMADPAVGAAAGVLICRPRLARLLLGAFARQAAAPVPVSAASCSPSAPSGSLSNFHAEHRM